MQVRLHGFFLGVLSVTQFCVASTEWRMRTWTVDDGLPSNAIRSILQTSDGYVWIGTVRGIARFDGEKFTHFSSSNSSLPASLRRTVLAEDSNTNLCIGTADGLFRYARGDFEKYTTNEGLSDNEIRSIHVGNSGAVWIGTKAGLSRWRDGKIDRLRVLETSETSPVRIIGLLEINREFLWIASPKTLERRTIRDWKADITFQATDEFSVHPFATNASGHLFVAEQKSLLRWANAKWTRSDFRFDSGVGGSFLVADHQGALWFGAGNRGVLRIMNGSVIRFDSASGMPNDFVSCAYEDRNGCLWFGGFDDGGVAMWQRSGIGALTMANGLPHDNVRALIESGQGGVWVGTDDGVIKLGLDSNSRVVAGRYSREQGLPINTIRALLEDRRGRLWIGSELGLNCAEGGSLRSFPVPGHEFERAVRVIFEDRSGAIWFGNKWGLHRVEGQNVVTYTETNGVRVTEVRAIFQDREGALWIGSSEDGLSRFSFDGRGQLIKSDCFTTAEGLTDNTVTVICEDDDGTIWVGTGEG